MKLYLRRIRQIAFTVAVILSSVSATIWFAVERGQDFNFDQRNYHIAVPYLLAHGTFWSSVAPCDIQTYFDPAILNAQFYAITHFDRLGPLYFAIALAIVQSLAFMIGGLICYAVVDPGRDWRALAACTLGYLLCLMAPVPLSEAGTTFVDMLISIPVLAAYTLLLTRGRWLSLRTSGILAGFLLGAAMALKLTSACFLLAAFGFALAGPDRFFDRLKWLSAYAFSAAVGFVSAGGSWYLHVWRQFKNPFFPYYNNFFHSPDYTPTSFTDARWLGHPFGFLHYPIYLLLSTHPRDGSTPSVSAEVAFTDARWIFALYGVIVFATIWLTTLAIKPVWAKTRLHEPATGLFFTFAIAFAISYEKFNIQRYIVPLDILCGAIILALATLIRPASLRLLVLAGAATLSFALIKVPDWGHIPWEKNWATVNPRPIKFSGPTVVFLLENPDSFIVTSLPAGTRYISMNGELDLRAQNDTSLTRQIKNLLSATPAPQLKSVDFGTIPAVATSTLSTYGLTVSNRCQHLAVYGSEFNLCDVKLQPPG